MDATCGEWWTYMWVCDNLHMVINIDTIYIKMQFAICIWSFGFILFLMWVCLKTGYTLQTVISIQNMMLNEWSSRCNAFRQTSIIWLVLYTKKCPILYTHYMVISHGENYTFIFPHISRIYIYIYIYVFIQEYISPIFQDLIPCNRGLTVPKQTSGDTAGEDHQIHGPRGWNRWRRWGRWQPAVRW